MITFQIEHFEGPFFYRNVMYRSHPGTSDLCCSNCSSLEMCNNPALWDTDRHHRLGVGAAGPRDRIYTIGLGTPPWPRGPPAGGPVH